MTGRVGGEIKGMAEERYKGNDGRRYIGNDRGEV